MLKGQMIYASFYKNKRRGGGGTYFQNLKEAIIVIVWGKFQKKTFFIENDQKSIFFKSK